MPATFDLDAFVADATEEPFRFNFGGEEYELPPSIDIRVVTAISAGRIDDGLRIMLGPDQYARIEKAKAVLSMPKLLALFNAYAEHSGMTLGESLGSSS